MVTPCEIIVGYCRDFTDTFPDQPGPLERALRGHGWDVTSHPALDQRFPDGELCVELPAAAEGRTVLLCQSLTGPHTGADQALMSLLAAARCYREHGAARIVAVLPHLAYARHDRLIPGQRRPVMAGLLADLASSAGLDALVSIASGAQDVLRDLFARAGTEMVFLSAHELQLRLLRPLVRPDTVLVAPDAGAVEQVALLAAELDLRHVVLDKHRTGPEDVSVRLRAPHDVGDMGHVVLVDDLITSGATVERTVEALREHRPALAVDVVATHLRPTPAGTRRLTRMLTDGVVSRVHTTDAAGHRPDVPGLALAPAIPWMATELADRLGAAPHPPLPERRTVHGTRR
ncbi:ribose-phosphate diphosphokinase [Streptomyces sp. NPDC048111]|uniref:ribose-phosphate diphosphokinase n=1 Tax=Streptomyces sp. NPDC048111 TaxID=3365500 RepID=UPI00371913E1